MLNLSRLVFRHVLLAVCYLSSFTGFAQRPFVQQLKDTCQIKPGLRARRAANMELLSRSLNYADLSYASPPFFDLGAPKAPYILSADIIPQFVIGGKWSPVALHITPRFKARIFRDNELRGDSSSPVRTPSYMPGATLYFKVDKLNENSSWYKFASGSLFHHSNGQDGNSLNKDGSYNQYNGSFSTNFAEVALYTSHKFNYINEPAFECANNLRSHYDFYSRLGFEKHFGTDVNMIGRYGQNRVNLKVGLVHNKVYRDRLRNTTPIPIPIPEKDSSYYSLYYCPTECYVREQFRVVLNTSFVTDNNLSDLGGKMNAFNRRINAEIIGTYRLHVSPNVAWMLTGGYYGSDPYNVYFEDSYFYVRAGLSFGFFTAPDYRDEAN